MKPPDPASATWEEIGKAAALSGMTYLAETLPELISEAVGEVIREFIEEFRAEVTGNGAAPSKRGRPPKENARGFVEQLRERLKPTGKSGWPADPKERSREMKRRQAVARAKKAGEPPAVKLAKALHPRDPNHPRHKQWLKKLRESNRRYWGGLSAEERKARVDTMLAKRRAA
jgi:hypothetical protein